jgi:hypothetical protein
MLNREALYKLLDLDAAPDLRPVTVYSEVLSERLHYVCEFIFQHVLGLRVHVTNDRGTFERSDAICINYSSQEIPACFHIAPHGLLQETGVSTLKPQAVLRGDMVYLFEQGGNKDFSYDIFSAIFYFISRYEEWQPFQADTHGRFEAKQALLFKQGFHLKPVVEIWISELRAALQRFYPEQRFPQRKFRVISTIDVDNLYAYKAKGLLRTVGACARDLLKADLRNLKERLLVLSGSKKDPFAIYDSISDFCFEHQIPLIYFFLLRSGTKYDRTVDPQSPAFDEVFKTLNKNHAQIGLHPSYDSSVQPSLLAAEKALLDKKTGKKTLISRQHYLRFNIKSTPKLLMEQGFEVDFSMGFASAPGFRAGTSYPFYYYDLEQEKKQPLLFVPFCVMDGVYTVYEHVAPEPAYEDMLALAKELKKAEGIFISVFHERSFSDHLYNGFGSLYKKLHAALKNL